MDLFPVMVVMLAMHLVVQTWVVLANSIVA